MHILITGATGFIGRYVTRELAAKGHRVRCLIRRTSDTAGLPDQAGRWYGDIREPETLRHIAAGIDIVVHLAAIGTINAVSSSYDAQYRKVNVEGTKNLIEACKEYAGRIGTFIHFSSLAAVEYRESAYGRSKYESELIVKKSGVPYVIVRPPLVYDWQNPDKELKKLASFIRLGIVPVIGDGTRKITALDVHNLVDATLALIHRETENDASRTWEWDVCPSRDSVFSPGENRSSPPFPIHSAAPLGYRNETYAIRDKKSYSLNEMISLLAESLRKKPFIVHIPPALVRIPVRIIERLAKVFGFVPPLTLKRMERMKTAASTT